MYAPTIIAERLEKARRSYGRRQDTGEMCARGAAGGAKWESLATLGEEWRRHTIPQVQSATNYFLDLQDEPGQFKRKLRNEERDFILNERIVCTCDEMYWATHYAYIKDWQNQIVVSKANRAQQIYNSVCQELEASRLAIDIQALKARQLGITTETEKKVCHRVTFYEGVNAVVGSSDPKKSEQMSSKMELIWERMPSWLLPPNTKYNAGELIEFGYQNSGVTINHGNQNAGIARGSTPTVVHLSELCDYADPEDLVDASLRRAIHESEYIFVVYESTAAGRHNWWHKTWTYNKEHWPRRQHRDYPLFLPWFVGNDLYPTQGWMLNHPIPANWVPARLTQNHAERARQFVRIDPLLKLHLGAGWEMPREQMYYWEVQYEEAKEKGTLNKFYSEMPADDEEAFQNTNMSAFDADIISSYREAVKKPPKAIYGIIGEQGDIPLRLQPDRRDIDPNLPPVNLTWRSSVGSTKRFQLAPIKFEGYRRLDPFGKLIVWEPPEDDYEYGFGVDTSDGVGLDRSCIEVLRKGTTQRNDEQVAEFASPYVNAHDLSPIALAIGTYYTNNYLGMRQQPKAVIECMRNGETVQHNLRLYGWTNIHQWVRYDQKKIQKGRAHKLGVMMVPWFRSMVIDMAIKYLRDGWVDINSPWFVSEMQDLERDDDRAFMRAMYGGHDDRIISLAIVLFSLHDMEVRGYTPLLAGQRPQQDEDQSHPGYIPPFQGTEMDGEEAVQSYSLYPQDEGIVDGGWN